LADVPNRSGSPRFASFVNTWSWGYPRIDLWIIVGLVALVLRRPRGVAPLVVLAAIALVTRVVILAGLPTVLLYRVPFDPLFMVFAIVSIGAASDTRRTRAMVSRLRRS
jgi:hypothetical protein